MAGRRKVGWASVASAVALLAAAAGARAGELVSPRTALEALPWASGAPGSAPSLAQVQRIAEERLAQVRRELGRQEIFERDQSSRRAVVHRREGDEAAALLAMEESRSREQLDLARPIQELVRDPRLDLEREEALLDASWRETRAACRSRACLSEADRRTQKARAELFARERREAPARLLLLRERLRLALSRRLSLAERVATATSDPYLQLQAKELIAESWRAVAELCVELEGEARLSSRLASR